MVSHLSVVRFYLSVRLSRHARLMSTRGQTILSWSQPMPRTRLATRISILGLLAFAAKASAQTSGASGASGASAAPHTIVITLIEQPGTHPYAFQPATFTAQHGDTLRFVQGASVMHDVHFTKMPKGAKLGGAATSQYLTAKGQTYVIVVDSRFVAGTYEIVCDPHDMVGMHAFLSVEGATNGGGAPK